MNHESGNLLNSSKVENFRAKFTPTCCLGAAEVSAFVQFFVRGGFFYGM